MFIFLCMLWSAELNFQSVTLVDWTGNLAQIITVTMGPEGRIFFVNPVEGKIYQTNLKGKALLTIGNKGEGPGELNWPDHIVYDEPYLYVLDGAREKLYRFDPDTGTVTKEWKLANISTFDIKGDQLTAAFMLPRKGHIFGSLKMQGNPLEFETIYGGAPCCQQVNGAKRSAVHIDAEGNGWLAYTGVFNLTKYSPKGRLLKQVTAEPPDYKIPSQKKECQPLRHSWFFSQCD